MIGETKMILSYFIKDKLEELKNKFCVIEECTIIEEDGNIIYPCEKCKCPVNEFIEYILEKHDWYKD